MQLRLNQIYKSFESFTVELPLLTILTGVNGAGKTQILTGINENQIQVLEGAEDLNPKKFVTHGTLLPNDSQVATRDVLTSNFNSLWDQFKQYLQLGRPNNPDNPQTQIPYAGIGAGRINGRLFEKIIKASDKQADEITIEDLFNFYPIDDIYDQDIFHQRFSIIFKRYANKIDENKYRKFRFQDGEGSERDFVSDEEFRRINGEPPWEFVNKIIDEAKLDYRVNSPSGSHRDAPFELKLTNKLNRANINFSDLSSGEKVLMSLSLALYNSNLDIEFPKVLLMDEPDASLHPSMSKQFLDVIQNVFVKDKGVRVIMTTHSPSTVALAPEEAIFIVNKTGERIVSSTKDAALKILTAGVPSFSVNYENRRQVFVESPNDVFFYEEMYKNLSNYLEPEISLSFISSGESRTDKYGQKVSNCGQVKNITEILRAAGNRFIFGIIDWDKENTSNEFIRVLGENKRYSIENYIFDPIFISALLLQEKVFTKSDLRLVNNETYSDFKNLSASQLQIISDYFTDSLIARIKPSDNTKTVVRFLNGIEIEMPIWYLQENGHNLEEQLKEVYPPLRRFDLKREVINKYINNIPGFISTDIVEVFRYIQIN